mgnify:FL=1
MLSRKNLAQDKQQVSKKKRGQEQSGHFMAGVCQKAYGNKAFKYKSTCRAVKCNACMLIGDGFQDEMVTTEQVELKKVGQRSLPAQPVRIRSKRVSKNNMTSSATVVKRYLEDDNGCSHDDPSKWNEERDMCYWTDKWKKAYYVKNKMGFELDYKCIICKKDVWRGFI